MRNTPEHEPKTRPQQEKGPRLVGTNSARVAVVHEYFRDVMERAARWIESEADANGFGADHPEAWQLAVSVIRDAAARDHRLEAFVGEPTTTSSRLRDESDDAAMAKAVAVLERFEVWADGYLNKRTGMGGGLHHEMWPSLSPASAKLMLETSRAAIAAIREIKP